MAVANPKPAQDAKFVVGQLKDIASAGYGCLPVPVQAERQSMPIDMLKRFNGAFASDFPSGLPLSRTRPSAVRNCPTDAYAYGQKRRKVGSPSIIEVR